jgi:hypothetical protein
MGVSSSPAESVLSDHLFYRLHGESERARWRVSDIPFDRIDRASVSPAMIALVRRVAESELTTFSATRFFLQAFADDTDFTQWMAVWFYEETKHPEVLMRWLSELGERFDAGFLRRGRATTSFMKSRFGTLVANVISEVVASHNYLAIHENAGESVLSGIGKHLAADEARHARTFLAYARRYLERSGDPQRDRADALKVLHLWFQQGGGIEHPVNEFAARAGDDGALGGAIVRLGLQGAAERASGHACRMIGSLLDLPLEAPGDALPALAALRREAEINQGDGHGQT